MNLIIYKLYLRILINTDLEIRNKNVCQILEIKLNDQSKTREYDK